MSETFFQFHSPGYLFSLFLVVPLFVFDVLKLRLVKFPLSHASLVAGAKKSWRRSLEFVPPFLRAAALVLIIIALARPQTGSHHVEVQSEGIDILLALDTSGSMRALDLDLNGREANRLEVIKAVVRDFIGGRRHDRMGMVVFGTEAYTQCPLTLDHDILLGYLDLIEIGIAGEDTAIGNAIALAVKRLKKSSAKSKIVVLVTDGENTAGEVSPTRAAELAAENGIKVYTIAVGTDGKVPFPQAGFFGVRKVYVELPVDEKTLQEIATITGGRFYKASDTQTLEQIYKTIDQLEKTEVKVDEFSEYEEWFAFFLVPAIVLLLMAWLLQRTVFLRIP